MADLPLSTTISESDARMVEVWHPDDEQPEIVTDVLRWRVGAEGEELAIDLGKIFLPPPTPRTEGR